MKQIINTPTNMIKPDPNQPRKTFDEKKIKEMAQSYSSQGIINPVEVDKNNMIITGEMRWRAAIVAGLKEVPCIVNREKLKPDDRLLRQCVENAHHSDMTVMDTAKAWKKLSTRWTIRKVAQKLGKTKSTIQDYISMLSEPKFVQKYLEDKSKGHTYFREANKIPEKYRSGIKKDIVKGKFKNRESVTTIAKAIKEKPELAEEIMDVINDASDIDFEVKALMNDYKPVPKTKKEPVPLTQLVLEVKSKIQKFWDTLKKCYDSSFLDELSVEMKREIMKTLIITQQEIEKTLQKFSERDKKQLTKGGEKK